jgi:outer membrane protein OmpA-like peptidoglycan-associated protein
MTFIKVVFYMTSIFVLINYGNSKSQHLENIGIGVNSDVAEVSPKITVDGKTLYFIRSIFKKEKAYQYIWKSELMENGSWGAAVKLEKPFNNADVNSVLSISPDGNTILYGEYFYKSNKGELYSTSMINNVWSIPINVKNMEDENQFINTKWASSCISNSGKIMLIAATQNKEDDFGEIYVCFKKDKLWSRAVKINSPLNIKEGQWGQHNPYLAADDVTLYFASERNDGNGGTDIYYSRRLDDTWLNWSEPVNMGLVINTKGYELFYAISAKGDYAYVVSNFQGYGREDIFRYKLPEEVRPKPVVLITGSVMNPLNNQMLDAEIYYYSLTDNSEAGTAKTNPVTGSYKIVLPYGKVYSYIAKVDGYYSISNYIDLTAISEFKEIASNIEMKPIEVGETFRLNNIFFDFNKSTLRVESFQELDRVIKLLNDNLSIEIELSGHTDNVGGDEYNLNLSQDRANTVVNYIISKGINSNRIISKGYGKSNPVATNDTEDGKQLNRRVEFKILKK